MYSLVRKSEINLIFYNFGLNSPVQITAQITVTVKSMLYDFINTLQKLLVVWQGSTIQIVITLTELI